MGAGEYAAFVYAVKGDEKQIVSTDTVHVLPNPEGPEVVTALQAELKAVDAAIAGVLAGQGVQSYTFETAVGRRSADRMGGNNGATTIPEAGRIGAMLWGWVRSA